MSEDRFYKDSNIDGHPIVDRQTGMIYTSAYKGDLIDTLNHLSRLADRATPIESGDKCYYERCFGDDHVEFVGMAKSINGLNDSVVIHRGQACPVIFSYLVKIE